MQKSLVDEILTEIDVLLKYKESVIVAIDGRCASGKTTLAKELQKKSDCNVIHLDDFFLRPEQRTEERFAEIGGNVDYERFLEEVLIPLKSNKEFEYRPFDCHTLDFKSAVRVVPNKITVVEGSYACNSVFKKYYDINLFLDVDKNLQLERIRLRNGEESLKVFKEKWIPLEEKYFENIKPDWRNYE